MFLPCAGYFRYPAPPPQKTPVENAMRPPPTGNCVYDGFIEDCDRIISKTYMMRAENENSRLMRYLNRVYRKTLCYSKSSEMLDL